MAQYRTDINKLDNQHLKTRYEVMMLSDRLSPSGTMTDAFGRMRISQPYTLFDSTHRYFENAMFVTDTSGTANTVHQTNESAIDMNVGATSGDRVYRESKRTFVYQPGKSLLIMNTFVMNAQKENLRQRVGYFDTDNGVYFENDGTGNYLVLRSYVTGSVVNTRIAQANWNHDKFDGTGYSSQDGPEHQEPIDISKSNIFWFDMEWLGVGDVRCGFVIDGRPVIAHVFHNDNIKPTTYMTSATLPIRYEIENTGTTTSASKMKQICSSVMSEGGYEIKGRSRTIGRAFSDPKDLPTAGTFTPVISIRIKDGTPNAVAIPRAASLFGVTNNMNYRYKIVTGGTLTGASWTSVEVDSFVEYDISATDITGGTDKSQGYLRVSAGAGAAEASFSGDNIFDFQLERNPFVVSNKGYIFSLVATGATNGADALGHISWEEIQ